MGKTRQCPQGPDVRLTSMSNYLTRRQLLKSWGLIVGAGVGAPQLVFAEVSKPTPSSKTDSLIRLSLNENPYGSSPNVVQALQLELGRLNRYADAPLARQLTEQIAEYEHVPVEQVVLGEILDWARITIGLSSENLRAQNALRTGLKEI